MGQDRFEIRKMYSQVEDVHSASDKVDTEGVLRKVAVCAVVKNPFAGKGYVEDLSPLTRASEALGYQLGQLAVELLDGPVAGYGKGGIVGSDGEQEHVNASLTSVFGNAFRKGIGGGEAWISSVTKTAGEGTVIDVPVAYKNDVWVRSHYDAVEVRVPGAPRPDELVIIATVTNRGRLNARVGGKSAAEAGEEKVAE